MAEALGRAVRDARQRRCRGLAERAGSEVLPGRQLGRARQLRRRQLGAPLSPDLGHGQGAGAGGVGRHRGAPETLGAGPALAFPRDGLDRRGGARGRLSCYTGRDHPARAGWHVPSAAHNTPCRAGQLRRACREGRHDRGGRDRRQPGDRAARMADRPARPGAAEAVDGFALLRRRRHARRGEQSRRQRDSPVAHVELRRRGAPPQTAARAPRAEADPAAVGLDVGPGRPPLRASAGDAHLRRLCGARAYVRGRAQVLVAGLQLQDRQARARCVRLSAQPPSEGAAGRAVFAKRAARQARAS